jgi:signal transduction histidine kinase/CheY-like chemotaxis protein
MHPKNGPEIFVQVKAQAAQESDGTGYCRLVMTDITERKQMEEALIHSEALGRAIINALSAHIAVLDEQGNIIATNNNWLRFGIENGVVARSAITEGANYLEVCQQAAGSDPTAREALTGIKAVLHGQTEMFTLEYPGHSPDEEDWFLMRITPLAGNQPGVVVAHENITARKQAEQALGAERASLASRVEKRTTELQEANVQLAQAMRLKDEFLANVSHELRTPLNVILGNTELLQDQFYGPLTPKQARAISLVDSSGQHLLELINDILDLSRIEAGKLELNPTLLSIRDICQASLDLVKQGADVKGIRLIKTFDAKATTIKADELRLKQILVNLLTNAVKFTPQNGTVGLEVHGDAENERLDVVVWDTGIGIAETNLAQIFEPFVQLDGGLDRRQEGTGLGLSLVWRLVEMHGGSVSIESKPDQGSRFTVSLPWQSSEPVLDNEPAAGSQPEQIIQAKNNTGRGTSVVPLVLLVEDNETNITTLSGFLEQSGFGLVVARNGLEAIERVQACRPDVILMDIQMPRMDGLETTRRLRSDAELCHVPIIALTALAMPGDREHCLAAGVDEYLSKPVKLKHLVEVIKARLNSQI